MNPLSLATLCLGLAGPAAQVAPAPAVHASSEKAEGFRLIDANTLQAALAAQGHAVHLYDANHEEFRQENGTLAGAVLLADPHDYPLSLLPPDKQAALVFYCSSRL